MEGLQGFQHRSEIGIPVPRQGLVEPFAREPRVLRKLQWLDATGAGTRRSAPVACPGTGSEAQQPGSSR